MARTAPTRKRTEQKLGTRDKVRQAAFELFTTAGYDDSRTKDVADRAGVAAGTVFLHARDKVDLLCLVMHDRLEAASNAGLASVPRDAALVDQLIHVFRALFDMYGEHPKLSAAFVKTFPGADGPNGQQVGALTFAFLHRLSTLVVAAIERGEVAPRVLPLVAAQSIFGLYFFALTSWISGYATLDQALDPGLRSALDLLMTGMRAPPAS